MKRLFVIFLLLFLPVVTVADNGLHDGCVENGKYKSEYTIDRRCYVTNEQKQISPYSAVVALLDDKNNIYCTGTIFRDNQDFLLEDAFKYETKLPVPGLFVYTAAHCINGDRVKIRLQNGKEIITERVSGIHSFWNKSTTDWAIYKIPEREQNGLPYVDIAYGENGEAELKVVGYGSLAIMTDKEIKDYKQAYIDFLKSDLAKKTDTDTLIEANCKNRTDGLSYDSCKYIYETKQDYNQNYFGRQLKYLDNVDAPGVPSDYFVDGAISTHESVFEEFNKTHSLPNNIDLLKESVCHMNSTDDFCQAWHGNSGGGIFAGDKIIAVVSNGPGTIGGKHHAAFLRDITQKSEFGSRLEKGVEQAVFLQNSQQDNLDRMRKAIKYTNISENGERE